MAELPSWLNRNYDPAATFLSAYQVGANIAQSKATLAEAQRRTNIESELQRESLQASMLKAQQELAVQNSYNNARINIEQAQLNEAAKRNQQVAENAAQQLAFDQKKLEAEEAYKNRMATVAESGEETAATNAEANLTRANAYDAYINQRGGVGVGGKITVKLTDKDTGEETTFTGTPEEVKAWKEANTPKKVESSPSSFLSWLTGTKKVGIKALKQLQ